MHLALLMHPLTHSARVMLKNALIVIVNKSWEMLTSVLRTLVKNQF